LKVLSQGLLDVGLLSHDKHGSLDDVLEKKAYFPFYMHRTSHWLGMDVHDCGSYVEPGEANTEPPKADPITGVVVQAAPQPRAAPGHGADLGAGLVCAPGRGRARAILEHRHSH
jgi:Xaa-Pro aminopeptidase